MAIDVAIIGLDWPGLKHAESLAALGARVAAVADPEEARTAEAAERHGARGYLDWTELLERETTLDAVVLAAPPALRPEAIEEICDRELALFCEGPPALELRAARRAARAARRAGILHCVGFPLRWSLCAAALRELIRHRPRLFARVTAAGPVLDWVRQGRAPASLGRKETSGGPLIAQGVALQDVLRFATGDEPVEVQAMAEFGTSQPAEGRDVEETTAVLVRYQSGMLCSQLLSWSHQGAISELQVVGPGFDLTWRMEGEESLSGNVGRDRVDERGGPDPYLEAMRGFLEALRRNDPGLLRSDLADACRSLAVGEAAVQAVETGARVTVPSV